MTVVMTAEHDSVSHDLDTVHEARVPSSEDRVGVTRCGLMFDLAQHADRFHAMPERRLDLARLRGLLVIAREVALAPTCMCCIASVLFR